MKKKDSKYPFLISNTDRPDKWGTHWGTHWWSLLDLHPTKTIHLFDIFGTVGYKKFKLSNNKVMVVKITFSRTKFETLDQRNFKKLSTTLRHLFHFISEFEKNA